MDKHLCHLLELIFNIMKKIFCWFLIFVGFILTAQNNYVKYNFLGGNSNSTFKSTLQNINIFQYKAFLNPNYLSLYNIDTGVNDNYFILGNRYVASNVKSISPGYLYGPKIDSFNPTGASDIKSALGIGTLNFLLQSF